MAQYDYRLYRAADTAAATGLITVVSNTTALTGSGTSFTTELTEGSLIFVAGQVLAIRSITDNDDAVLQTAPAVGFSLQSFTKNNLINIQSLTPSVYAPKSTYKPWQQKIDLVNGQARGVGRPSCAWLWGFITQGQYGALRTILAGASASTYIRTRTTENTDRYDTFSAAFLWPDEIDRQATRRVNFSIQFRDLVIV